MDETSALSDVMSAVSLGKASLIAQMREAAGFFFNIEKLTFGNREISSLPAGTVIAEAYCWQATI